MESELFVFPSGLKKWCSNDGRIHRVGGPAVVYPSGSEEWWFEGKLHRVDGPAITTNGYESWYLKGKRHRVGGPAIIKSDGSGSWFLHGEQVWWEDVLGRISQPGYVLSPFEVSMVEYHLEKSYGA